jgi:hypothetical protein
VPEQSFSMTRRQFGMSLGASSIALSSAASPAFDGPWNGPAKVKKVYIAKAVPSWPRPDLDVEKEKAAIEAKLAEVERKHAGRIQFVGGDLLIAGNDISGWVRDIGDVDAILIVDLTSGTASVLDAMGSVDTPMLLFTRPYSGWSYVNVAAWMQKGRKADLVASSEFDDLDPYLRIFQSVHHLRKSKVVVVTPAPQDRSVAESFTRQFDTAMSFVPYQDLKTAFEKADTAKAKQDAEEFTKGALRVVEPSAKDVVDSMRLYLAIKDILQRENANAMTIDCLGGFRRGDLPAYPCVAWSKLNDTGLYGVCEGDILSTMTQLMLTSFSGKPGFVSDPVFDTSRNEVIHAHCVAATSMLGIGGPSSPYLLRSHMEDNKGVSLQVMMPVGDTVTVGKFASPGKFLLSPGVVVGNVDDPRGCRTKIRTRVASARKMLTGFSGGLHRVVYYGDYVEPIEAMGRLMGFQVVHEM